MAHLYLGEDLPAAAFHEGALIEVGGDEARHAVRVARLRRGETTLIGNGAGVWGRGEVVTAERDALTVRLVSVETVLPRTPRIVLAQALAKGDRAERAVEQATEFGVDAIVPWQAHRSVSRWDETKAVAGAQKWRRIAREASKQSLRAWLPEVEPLSTPTALAARAGGVGIDIFVLHPAAHESLSSRLHEPGVASAREVIVVIGPEGGFADDELDVFVSAGARLLRLGTEVLRTSSAGPAAICLVNHALGRW